MGRKKVKVKIESREWLELTDEVLRIIQLAENLPINIGVKVVDE